MIWITAIALNRCTLQKISPLPTPLRIATPNTCLARWGIDNCLGEAEIICVLERADIIKIYLSRQQFVSLCT
ncbi:MAG: hypothetical protein AAFY26_24360, partial [Cyanobacteria bacterium J06638_22]